MYPVSCLPYVEPETFKLISPDKYSVYPEERNSGAVRRNSGLQECRMQKLDPEKILSALRYRLSAMGACRVKCDHCLTKLTPPRAQALVQHYSGAESGKSGDGETIKATHYTHFYVNSSYKTCNDLISAFCGMREDD